MAEIILNEKGFKVIKLTVEEIIQGFKGFGIFDSCCKQLNPKDEKFYVCVLHYSLCPTCYDSWNNRAVFYPEDQDYENRNFNQAKRIFNL